MNEPKQDSGSRFGVTRRWLMASGASLSAGFPFALGAQPRLQPRAEERPSTSKANAPMEIIVNGTRHSFTIDPRTTLLDALRERLALTGTKKGCDHGQCGACTVNVGSRPVLSCLTLAAAVREPVTTIEGLARNGSGLHPMQQAFLDQDAFQCGFCTPGQIMSAVSCLDEGQAGSDAEIREYMSGNLCRCAAYPRIVAAVRQVRDRSEKGGG